MADLFEGAPESWLKDHILTPDVIDYVRSGNGMAGRNSSPDYQNTQKAIADFQAANRPRHMNFTPTDQLGAPEAVSGMGTTQRETVEPEQRFISGIVNLPSEAIAGLKDYFGHSTSSVAGEEDKQ
jgi:hypothetical protein